jgi:hypothetical protein
MKKVTNNRENEINYLRSQIGIDLRVSRPSNGSRIVFLTEDPNKIPDMFKKEFFAQRGIDYVR